MASSHLPLIEGLEGRCLMSVSVQPLPLPAQPAPTPIVVPIRKQVGVGVRIMAMAGREFTGRVGHFRAPAGLPGIGEFQASIDWGDGQVADGKVLALGRGRYLVRGAHTWTDAGKYKVRITISYGPKAPTDGSPAPLFPTRIIGNIDSLAYVRGKPLPIL